MQVIGADQIQTLDDLQQEAFIRRHFDLLRADLRFKKATIVTIIEANIAWVTASHLARLIAQYEPVIHLTEDRSKNNRIGVWMTHDHKITMRRDLCTLLDTERINFRDQLISADPEIKGTICNQLRAYRYEVKPVTDTFARERVTLTGKSSGSTDDLAITTQMVVTFSQIYFTNPESVVKIPVHYK